MNIGLIIMAIVFGIPILCLAAICVFYTVALIKDLMQ